MQNIVEIKDNKLKSEITENILRGLPEWFGHEESLLEYINGMDDKTFFAYKTNEEYIGFFALEFLYNNVCNLKVLGFKKEFRNQGIGTKMYNYIENYLKEKNIKYITVYTLSYKSDYEYYMQTREFYRKLGFEYLYESDKVWDEDNPFLLMIKTINGDKNE